MKKFCQCLKKHAKKITKFKKKIKLLTNEWQESYKILKICYIWKEKFEDEYSQYKKYRNRKVRDHCHHTGGCRGAANSIWSLKYNIPKNIFS